MGNLWDIAVGGDCFVIWISVGFGKSLSESGAILIGRLNHYLGSEGIKWIKLQLVKQKQALMLAGREFTNSKAKLSVTILE